MTRKSYEDLCHLFLLQPTVLLRSEFSSVLNMFLTYCEIISVELDSVY
jgi:hypothetical protein